MKHRKHEEQNTVEDFTCKVTETEHEVRSTRGTINHADNSLHLKMEEARQLISPTWNNGTPKGFREVMFPVASNAKILTNSKLKLTVCVVNCTCDCNELDISRGLTIVRLHVPQSTYNCRGIIYHPAMYCGVG
jgi:hypothetical protein